MINIEIGQFGQWWVQSPLSVKDGMFETLEEAKKELLKRNYSLAESRGLLEKPFPSFPKETYREFYKRSGLI